MLELIKQEADERKMREIYLEVQARRKAEAKANLTSYMTSFKLTNTGEVIPKRKQFKA